MNEKRLLRHTKKYLKDFSNNFCKGMVCGETCPMKRESCILRDLVNATNKAIELNDKRRK